MELKVSPQPCCIFTWWFPTWPHGMACPHGMWIWRTPTDFMLDLLLGLPVVRSFNGECLYKQYIYTSNTILSLSLVRFILIFINFQICGLGQSWITSVPSLKVECPVKFYNWYIIHQLIIILDITQLNRQSLQCWLNWKKILQTTKFLF